MRSNQLSYEIRIFDLVYWVPYIAKIHELLFGNFAKLRKSDVHNWYSCNICFWGGLTSFTPFFCRFHAGIEKGSLKIEKNWNFSPDGSKFQTFFSIFREPFSIPLWKRRKNGWKLVKSPGKVTFHTLITFRVKEIANCTPRYLFAGWPDRAIS